MHTSQQNSCGAYAWQATLPIILTDLRDEFELANNTSSICYQPIQKKLTAQALVMIFVILCFVFLNLIRTSVSVYRNFKTIEKEAHSSIIWKKEKVREISAHAEVGRKLFETSRCSVYLQNLEKYFDCFCIIDNARRIFSNISTEDQLTSLHGIKSIGVIWVLIGHTSLLYINAIKVPEKLQSALEWRVCQILENTVFAVDAFLILSGFLNGYLFSQRYKIKNGEISWISFCVRRYIRVAPMYFIVLGFYATLFPYLGSGPMWPTYDTNPICKEKWMWNVLFINNFSTHKQQCLTTTWYLACDMQLYIVSLIFQILLMKRPNIGYIIILFGISGSCLTNFIITKQYKLVDGFSRLSEYYTTDLKYFNGRFLEYYDALYVTPYSRLGVFLMGIVLGCYLSQQKTTTIKRNNLINLYLGWIVTAMFMWISMFGLYGREESIPETAVYNGLKHVLFASGVAWIIFVCVTGQGGFVKRFLSIKCFLVISRLSYTTYLTHLIILEGYFLSLKELIDYSAMPVIFLHAQLLFTMLAVSFVVTLLFEAPISRITALFLSKNNRGMKADKED